jgi:hypothetical protein
MQVRDWMALITTHVMLKRASPLRSRVPSALGRWRCRRWEEDTFVTLFPCAACGIQFPDGLPRLPEPARFPSGDRPRNAARTVHHPGWPR